MKARQRNQDKVRIYLYAQKIPGKIFFCHKRREEAGLVIELGVERK